MFDRLILNHIENKYGSTESTEARQRIGILMGFIGLALNVLLTLSKVVVGILSNSISVIADAINNLSDAVSSLVIILGLRIANAPPDKDHPYGHGRMEYITGLVVSFLVLFMGLQFLFQSVSRLRNPEPMTYLKVTIIFLVISIVIKIWMGYAYNKLYKRTQIIALKATATDAFGDVLITAVVLVAYIVGNRTDLPADGIAGIVVSGLIIKAGVELIKDTMSPLLGEAPDPEVMAGIIAIAEKEPAILGTHDLHMHNYGPGRYMATMDVEFSSNNDVMAIHSVIDKIEKEVEDVYDVNLVIHSDPIYITSPQQERLYIALRDWVNSREDLIDFHDFRMIDYDDDSGEIMHFEITVDGNKSEHLADLDFYREKAGNLVHAYLPGYAYHVDIDIGFDLVDHVAKKELFEERKKK